MGKYKDAYEKMLECVEEMDNEDEALTSTGKYYKLRLLRIIHQISAYTERPSAEEIDKIRRNKKHG